jgi:hypothetical protein
MLVATVNLHKIKIYTKQTKKKVCEKSLENLKDNKTRCFSKKAQTRLLDKTEAFLSAFKRSEIVFCTLTLPAKQKHTDVEIKTVLLNKFFNKLKKRVGDFEYIWKAERQENENIHFHFLTYKKMHHNTIRETWNSVLEKYGYIEDYRKAHENLTLDEYIAKRKELAKKHKKLFDLEKCKQAYYRAKAENWSNPNTTDIKALRKIKSVVSYICKYMKKDKKDIIEGRYWGASERVKKLKKLELNVSDTNCRFWQELNKNFKEKTWKTKKGELRTNLLVFDYCTVYLLNILKINYFKKLYIEYGKRNKEILLC